MANEQIFIILSDNQISSVLERLVLVPEGYQVTQVRDRSTLDVLLQAQPPDLMIIGDQIPEGDGLELAARLMDEFPDLPILLASDPFSDTLLLKSLRLGIWDYLYPPFEPEDVLVAVQHALLRKAKQEKWLQRAGAENADILQKRLDGLEALQRIGRKVTSSLDLDSVLAAVVDSAVELTGAEEGSLLLVDEASGELYMRAARNFREDFVRTFRVPVKDTLPGEVLRTGQPLLLNTATPKKIKTSYLVHTLMYVPMQVGGQMIGVLGVDNRRSGHPFNSFHLDLVYALADYTAIALENARLYANTKVERNKFETLLTGIQDCVIVIDQGNRIMLMNPSARAIFNLEDDNPTGKRYQDVIQHPDLLEILIQQAAPGPYRGEITLEDGRVLSAQVTPIPDVGLAVLMQDITYLKELDRIKSDFVSTVSHDLRSPLTAILGYVELITRVGSLNASQKDFIQRIEVSVQNITSLINDLLELGRIEAGFDARKEILPLSAIMRYTVESMQSKASSKDQLLSFETPEGLPHVLGNPVRLRQLLANLIDNAIEFTPKGGEINVRAATEDGQIILQVSDNGMGIPLADQPYVFDKFYRASNIPPELPGAGLGLSIVKSIVENHRGRIWVESTVGQGSTFTVVLPVVDQEL
jgi:two-component system phosphate regulon sensor histidine kinase PhoR